MLSWTDVLPCFKKVSDANFSQCMINLSPAKREVALLPWLSWKAEFSVLESCKNPSSADE